MVLRVVRHPCPRAARARAFVRSRLPTLYRFGVLLRLGIVTWVLTVTSGLWFPDRSAIAMSPQPTVSALEILATTEIPAITDPGHPGDDERLGRAALERQDYNQAVAAFKAAIATYEGSSQWAAAAGAAYMLSRTYLEMGELSTAVIALNQGFDWLDQLATPPTILHAQLQAQRGQLQRAEGLTRAAVESWQTAIALYQDSADAVGTIATQLDLATGYQALGLYPQARQVLATVEETITSIDDVELQALYRLHVADLELVFGQREAAQLGFEAAYQLTEHYSLEGLRSTLLSRLAHLAHDRGDRLEAVTLYEQAAQINPGSLAAIAAELGAIHCELELTIQAYTRSNAASDPSDPNNPSNRAIAPFSAPTNVPPIASRARPQTATANPAAIAKHDHSESPELELALQGIFAQMATLPDSQAEAQLQVYLTERVRDWARGTARWAIAPQDLAERLRDSLIHRRNAGDLQTQAQILDTLAQLYHDLKDFEAAIELTQDAIALASQTQARERLAIYHHHLGRLLMDTQQSDAALTAYRQAIEQLQTLRQPDSLSNAASQLSFQTTVEPIYREAIGLLLRANADQAKLREARDTLEALQLAEIENYFRENCLTSQPIDVGEIDPRAAILYPIVLPDRLEILLSLPNQTMLRHTIMQSEADTIAATIAARSSLSRSLGIQEQQPAFQRLYRWFITPFAHRLAQANIETLVFVLDTPFRNIPMAALFDGQHYVVEHYNIALAPSLQLLETTRQKHGAFSVFIGGLEAARQGFRPLPGVRYEVETIAAQVASELRLDEKFTLQHLKEALRYSSHPILHLATHGQFGSTPESTFVLAWDGKLDLTAFRDELLSRDEVRHGAIDLLVLSACETAIGDQLAILGMAGFAVQSGARATIASLWGVNDNPTAKQRTFLNEALARQVVTKAAALREAQLKTIALGGEYAKPFYWAPFVLIGNWL